MRDFIERNYEQAPKLHERKRQSMLEKQEEKLAKLFKPTISANSKELAKKFQSDTPSFEELYRHASLFAEKKKAVRE